VVTAKRLLLMIPDDKSDSILFPLFEEQMNGKKSLFFLFSLLLSVSIYLFISKDWIHEISSRPRYNRTVSLNQFPRLSRQFSTGCQQSDLFPSFDIFCFETYFNILKTLIIQEILSFKSFLDPIVRSVYTSSDYSYFSVETHYQINLSKSSLSILYNRLDRIIYSLKDTLENDDRLMMMNLSLFQRKPDLYL
jgi:hypothetical protein